MQIDQENYKRNCNEYLDVGEHGTKDPHAQKPASNNALHYTTPQGVSSQKPAAVSCCHDVGCKRVKKDHELIAHAP